MRLRILAAALLALCLLAVPGARASTRPFIGVLASATPVQPPPPPFSPQPRETPFEGACGTAVDGAGHAYVSDYHHAKVALYDSSGEFLSSIPSGVGANAVCDLAVDSTGQLFGNLLHQGVLALPGLLTIDPEPATGIAIGPANHLYIAHRTHVSVRSAGGGSLLQTIGLGTLGDAYGVAVSSFPATAGYVYVADAASQSVKVFDPAVDPLAPIQVLDAAGAPGGGFTDLRDTDLAIDPTSGNLLVIDNLAPGAEHSQAAVDELAPDGTYLGQIAHWSRLEGSPAAPLNRSLIDARPSGVAVDGTGRLYVTSGEGPGAVLYQFGSAHLPTAPLRVGKTGAGAGTVASQLQGISSASFTGINCGRICASEYELGTAVSLTATPAPHSSFSGWSVAGQPGACPGTARCTLTLGAAAQVSANFAPIPQRTLTLTTTGAGSVISDPAGIDCGAVCAAGFDQGQSVRLAAEAVAGSRFAGWSGACSGTGPCELSLATDANVAARFEPIAPPSARVLKAPPTLSILLTGAGNGTVLSDPGGVECGLACAAAYALGSTVTLTAKPDGESHFAGWEGCERVTGASCAVTLGGSRSVGARFEEGAALRVLGATGKGARLNLRLALAQAGTVRATAKGLAPAKLTLKRPGQATLHLKLNKRGRARLAAARGGRLALALGLHLTAAGGSAAEVLTTTTVVFKRGGKK